MKEEGKGRAEGRKEGMKEGRKEGRTKEVILRSSSLPSFLLSRM